MKFQIVKGEKLLKMYNIFFLFLLHWGQGNQSGAALVCVGFFFEKRGAEVPSLSV